MSNETEMVNLNNSLGTKSKLLVINDSDYKNTRNNKITFSTKYLNLKEEIVLFFWKNMLIYSRNIKTIFFVLVCPIILLFILRMLDEFSDYYNNSLKIKNYPEILIDNITLNCRLNENFKEDCISIGISTFVF